MEKQNQIKLLTKKLEEATGKKVVLKEGQEGLIQEANRIIKFAQILKESVSKVPSKYKPENIISKLNEAILRLENKLENKYFDNLPKDAVKNYVSKQNKNK